MLMRTTLSARLRLHLLHLRIVKQNTSKPHFTIVLLLHHKLPALVTEETTWEVCNSWSLFLLCNRNLKVTCSFNSLQGRGVRLWRKHVPDKMPDGLHRTALLPPTAVGWVARLYQHISSRHLFQQVLCINTWYAGFFLITRQDEILFQENAKDP